MTDPAPPVVPVETSATTTRWAKEDRRLAQRAKNNRLFDAVQSALNPPRGIGLSGEPRTTSEQRLDAIRQAVAAGGDLNARATRVEHGKARPLGMVAGNLRSPHAIEVMAVLLELGANLAVRDREGNTFTHDALRQLWGSRITSASLANLGRWLELGGAAHLGRKNQAQDTPLSVVLRNGSYGTPMEVMRTLVRTLTQAGATVEDLPPTLLSDLLIKNHRLEFDLAVELGMDVQQRFQTTGYRTDNLWAVWAHRYFGHNARHHNLDLRRAWMERLIEIGVDAHTAHDPNQDGFVHTPPETPRSALMVMLVHALPEHRLDEVCLARLKALGCALSTPEASPVHRYAAQGKADHLAVLHQMGFDLASLRDPFGETLLHAACSADLRGSVAYQGEALSIQDTVRVLLEAGCNPNVMPDPRSERSSALVEAVINHRTFRDRFDKPATLRMLLDAGADLEAGGPSSDLVGHTMYPGIYSPQPAEAVRGQWRPLVIDEVDLAVLSLLLQYGARVPQRITPDGMPLLLGLKGCVVSGRAGATILADTMGGTTPSLWERMVANEDPDWAPRLAHQAIDWLARRNWATGVPKDRVVPIVDWMIEHGVPAQALGRAVRASSFPADDPLRPFLETMELKAEMREAMPPDHELPLTRRPRL